LDLYKGCADFLPYFLKLKNFVETILQLWPWRIKRKFEIFDYGVEWQLGEGIFLVGSGQLQLAEMVCSMQ
jgi:hypothetical protein